MAPPRRLGMSAAHCRRRCRRVLAIDPVRCRRRPKKHTADDTIDYGGTAQDYVFHHDYDAN